MRLNETAGNVWVQVDRRKKKLSSWFFLSLANETYPEPKLCNRRVGLHGLRKDELIVRFVKLSELKKGKAGYTAS